MKSTALGVKNLQRVAKMLMSATAYKEGDTEQEIDGTKIFVDEISLPYIAGTTLDYVEGLHAGGFRFDNPRASRTCGCGSSFSA